MSVCRTMKPMNHTVMMPMARFISAIPGSIPAGEAR
jgi:hypothetical protein